MGYFISWFVSLIQSQNSLDTRTSSCVFRQLKLKKSAVQIDLFCQLLCRTSLGHQHNSISQIEMFKHLWSYILKQYNLNTKKTNFWKIFSKCFNIYPQTKCLIRDQFYGSMQSCVWSALFLCNLHTLLRITTCNR